MSNLLPVWGGGGCVEPFQGGSRSFQMTPEFPISSPDTPGDYQNIRIPYLFLVGPSTGNPYRYYRINEYFEISVWYP